MTPWPSPGGSEGADAQPAGEPQEVPAQGLALEGLPASRQRARPGWASISPLTVVDVPGEPIGVFDEEPAQPFVVRAWARAGEH